MWLEETATNVYKSTTGSPSHRTVASHVIVILVVPTTITVMLLMASAGDLFFNYFASGFPVKKRLSGNLKNCGLVRIECQYKCKCDFCVLDLKCYSCQK